MNPTCLPALKLAAVSVKMSMLSQDILPIFHSLFILQNSWGKRQNICNFNDKRSRSLCVYSICFMNMCDTYAQWKVCIVTADKMITVSLFMLVARDSSFVSFGVKIHHFPCFFHQIIVPEASATWNLTENKHNGRELCEPQCKNKWNLMDSEHVEGKNSNIFNTIYWILLKCGRVNSQRQS